MLNVKEALSICMKNIHGKKITGIIDWNGKYVFGLKDESLKDSDDNYDSTCGVVDKNTGEFSTMSFFDDVDLVINGKDIDFPNVND